MHTVFLAKTNLNNDGRILNQMRILKNHYENLLKIDFLLLEDRPLTIKLDNSIEIHKISTMFRNLPFFRVFTVFEFSLKVFNKLRKLKPKTVHAHDLAVVLPVYLYRLTYGKSFKLIYDDHEMPNENESLQYRVFQFFERKLLRDADWVLFANQERMNVVKASLTLQNNVEYFLNLPYFEDEKRVDITTEFMSKINLIKQRISNGDRFIMHQGSLEVERGREKLASFSRILPRKSFLLIVGVSQSEFEGFVREYELDIHSFFWVGSVPYNTLNSFWQLVSAAVVMYLPTYVNNRLCAPNRLYIAVNNNIPVLVNEDNPVLRNFVENYKVGNFIERMRETSDVEKFLSFNYTSNVLTELKERESQKFISVYENL